MTTSRAALIHRLTERLTGLLLPPRLHGGRARLTPYDAAVVAESVAEDFDAMMVAMSAAAAEARQHAINGWVAWFCTPDNIERGSESQDERAMTYDADGFPQWLRDGIEEAFACDRAQAARARRRAATALQRPRAPRIL